MTKGFARVHRILRELRRRHVFRVTGAYAVCAFFTIQITDIVFPALLVPEWVQSVLVILAIIGLPVVVFLTWVYDLTPQGVERTAPAGDDIPPVKWNWRWLDFLIIACLLGILAFVLLSDAGEDAEPRPGRSIAVLPFADLSPAGDTQYFSDGMAEAILDSLARVPDLVVISRTSSFSFRGADMDVRRVADELGVSTILEGSVRRAGDQLRVSARLIDGESGRNLWNDTYEGTLGDVFQVQDNISRAIVDVLQIRLLGDQAQALVQTATENPAAYDDYLRGRDWLRREPTRENIERAISFFSRALQEDPGFVLAEAGLCTAYWEEYVLTHDGEVAEQAISACQRAEQHDETRAEILVALGNLYAGTGRLEESESVLRQALRLEPNSAEAHAGLGQTLRAAGTLQDAARHLNRALELDPAYWRHYFDLSRVLLEQENDDQAIEMLNKAIRLQPDNPITYLSLGGIYYYRGEYLKAADATRKSIELDPNPMAYSNAANFYFYAGDYVQAEAMFRQATLLSPSDMRWQGFLADTILMQEDRDEQQALEYYEAAIRLGRQHLEVNPADHGIRALLARFLVAAGRDEAALEELVILEDRADMGMLAHRAMALAYMELDMVDLAMEHFAAAVEKGFPPRELRRDPRLEVLRDNAEFMALVQGETDNQ